MKTDWVEQDFGMCVRTRAESLKPLLRLFRSFCSIPIPLSPRFQTQEHVVIEQMRIRRNTTDSQTKFTYGTPVTMSNRFLHIFCVVLLGLYLQNTDTTRPFFQFCSRWIFVQWKFCDQSLNPCDLTPKNILQESTSRNQISRSWQNI